MLEAKGFWYHEIYITIWIMDQWYGEDVCGRDEDTVLDKRV